MNKVICDICGTLYPETNDKCPICGSSREYAQENPDCIPGTMPEYIPENRKKTGARSDSESDNNLLYDAIAPENDTPDDVFPEEERNSGNNRINVVLVIGLSLLVLVMLFGIGFLFFKYYLPNVILPEESTALVNVTEVSEVTQATTEAPTIPCESLILTTGVPEITRIGQYWLLHVIAVPEDTTDVLSFFSADESVVTVTEEGRLCAVGEGETTIVITCGNQEILCPVTVHVETLPPTEEAEKSPEVGAELASEPQDVDEETQPTTETEPDASQASETTPAISGNAENGIILKLKQTDISFSKKGVTFQLELDCQLAVEDVQWYTMNSNVAICHDGLITVLGSGTTKIVAKYGNQEVYCIVRCNLK